MGQSAGAWCRDGRATSGELAFCTAGSGASHDERLQSSFLAHCLVPPPDAERLLAGCPRELADAIRQTGQWGILRCRPWLTPGALRGLHRNLQRCQLRQLADRYREAEAREKCDYAVPLSIPWAELDQDHVVSAGQVFRCPDIPYEKGQRFRRIGLMALRQGKVGVALLAGGANLRLGGGEPPVGCTGKTPRLHSGKSILQLCCERIRRAAALSQGLEDRRQQEQRAEQKKPIPPRPSIPVFVMTSRLTHRAVVEHFEAHDYFGLPPRDVSFFEQPVAPVLDELGNLLPQSLGGEFAHAPGGTGQVIYALANSSALEQMRDRGVECLHIVGTENLLARVCDPGFLGFCRDLDIDCACKVVERLDASEDMELFCVRQNPVSTQYADIEDAACGVPLADAPEEMVNSRHSISGNLLYLGSINSVYMAVSYAEEVVGRRVRVHWVPRIIPYLDFHIAAEPDGASCDTGQFARTGRTPPDGKRTPPPPSGVKLASWPAETTSPDLACQRALMAAAAELRAQCRAGSDDSVDAWRCDVHLDCSGPQAVVRVRTGVRGPTTLPTSFCGAGMETNGLADCDPSAQMLRCSLVVPSRPNAFILETSLLDYFAFTDRAVALQVSRASEFAPIREPKGHHTADAARRALHALHSGWAIKAGCIFDVAEDRETTCEVSPLLSYEGEGLSLENLGGPQLSPPWLFRAPDEADVRADSGMAAAAVEGPTDCLDVRPFYLQEYPRRLELSRSHSPRFPSLAAPAAAAPPAAGAAKGASGTGGMTKSGLGTV